MHGYESVPEKVHALPTEPHEVSRRKKELKLREGQEVGEHNQ